MVVFPEGAKGAGKPFGQRYRLQRFGRGGFVEVALRTGSPIVPVAVVGGEEIHPSRRGAALVARLLRAAFFPLTPTFLWLGCAGNGAPSVEWRIEFCEPIETSAYGPDAADDRALVLSSRSR